MTGASAKPSVSTMLANIHATITAIQSQFGGAVNQGEDLYEVYIFTEIIAIVQKHCGVRPTLENLTGSTFVVRRSPGQIWTGAFSWAAFSYRGTEYEIHLGVRFAGISGTLHEADVSILRKAAAVRARISTQPPAVRAPAARSVYLIVECKYYKDGIPLGFGRSLLGSMVEFPWASCALVSTTNASSVVALTHHHFNTWKRRAGSLVSSGRRSRRQGNIHFVPELVPGRSPTVLLLLDQAVVYALY